MYRKIKDPERDSRQKEEHVQWHEGAKGTHTGEWQEAHCGFSIGHSG